MSALNGGLPRWIEEGNDVDTEELKTEPLAKERSAYPLPKKHEEYVRSESSLPSSSTPPN